MASYYLSFRCDLCEELAGAAIIGLETHRQDEIFAPETTYPATCKNGHRSTYFLSQLIKVHRKLMPIERQIEPKLIGDHRFVDIQ
jgi:hypothetical protein